MVPCFARADNDKMQAANESDSLKMNIIVIIILPRILQVLIISVNFKKYMGNKLRKDVIVKNLISNLQQEDWGPGLNREILIPGFHLERN